KLVAAARPPARIDGAVTVVEGRRNRRPSGAPTESANGGQNLTQTGHFFMTNTRASLRSDNCPTSIGMSVRFELEHVSDFVGMRSSVTIESVVSQVFGEIKLEEAVVPCGVEAGLRPVLVLINDQKFTKTA